ncbi:MAG: tetratricopeptide repeat protein [Helicobacter sp.]|nr:tetratricopeptide repeat protein [Helicobacteraceae bacterium]MDY3114298.1 tetratricopeptide repeat protein [Helicobacter sp.]
MDFLEGIDYRDPLFGIMLFIFLIGVIFLFAYYYNYILSKKKQQSIAKFIESFDYIGFDKEIREFLALSANPLPSLLFMAKMYQKSADYEKAIRLFITLLDSIKNPIDKIPILESLGVVYEKAGFKIRAKEIYLEILHHYPRNPLILKALIKIYEELKAYKDALDALECLEEIQGNTNLHKKYLQAKILILNKIDAKEKGEKLLNMLKIEPRLTRLILGFFKDFYPTLFWQSLLEIKPESLFNILDIIWNLKEIPQDIKELLKEIPQNKNEKILKDLLEAKGILPLSVAKKESFELEALCLLKAHKSFLGDLNFSYQCNVCKAISPLSFERCPHCGALLECKVNLILKEKQDEARYSFL